MTTDHPAPHSESLSFRLAGLTTSVARATVAPAALEAARRLIQHAFGVCVAGSALRPSVIARQALGHTPGPCLMFGSAAQHGAQDAAFANAIAGHASLLEDAGPGGMLAGSHPATYVFPAALAAAQERAACGMDLLRAVCAAYETVDALGAIMPAEVAQRGFRPVSVLGPFGAAAAAGVLAGLSQTQLAASYGLAANLSGGLNQGFVDGTMEPYLHPAFAARNGLMAVRLVLAGCTASPHSLDGARGFFASFAGRAPQRDLIDARLNPALREWAVCRVGAKDYATCLYNQGTLALVQLQFPGGLAGDSIERITLARPASGLHGLAAPGVAAPVPADANPLQLQMSARFTTAAALLGRPVDSAAWFETAPADGAALALASRVELLTHDSPGIRIEVVLRDGKRELAQAGPQTALVFSSDRIAAAFLQRVHPLLGDRAAQAGQLLAALPQLTSLDELTRLFHSHTPENP